MAVQKSRKSNSKRDMRRAHLFLKEPPMSTCKNCGSWKVPHHICSTCNHYKI